MKINITHNNKYYKVDLNQGKSIAITLDFNQHQPNHFDAEPALRTPMSVDGFIGDTRQSGSCNVNVLSFNPHCNGTHTETVGHICHIDDNQTTTIDQLAPPLLIPVSLVTIAPQNALLQSEPYVVDYAENDVVITKSQLAHHLDHIHDSELTSLIIRTSPNNAAKRYQRYSEDAPNAFLTTSAIEYILARGVEHLVVDMPSIDKMHDNGLLNNHHIFWQVEQGMRVVNNKTRANCTITELAYIESSITDGFYFISLQTPAFVNDAAPSRPTLFKPEASAQSSTAVFKE